MSGLLALLLYPISLCAREEAPALFWQRSSQASTTIVLGIHCRSDFSIDWGDGELEEFSGRNYGVDGIKGQYKGETIRIYGNPQDFVALYLGNNERGNGISALNITQLRGLRFLHCPNNELEELDLSSNYMLEELHLANNKLKSLSLRQCPKLDMLICYGNKLASLDLSENPRLMALRCEENHIEKLEVGHLTELTVLRCGSNPIDQLDVLNNKKLQQLYIDGSHIKQIDLHTLRDLRVLNINNCGFTDLDVAHNVALHVLYANKNALTQLVLNHPEMEKVEVSNNRLQSITAICPVLTDLRCSDNLLQSLDVSHLPQLSYLFCERNRLEQLDLRKNTVLCELLASDNRLRDIDLTRNTELYLLWLDGNLLVQLDISPFSQKLFSLFLANNKLPLERLQLIVDQLPDISSITSSESKAWWKKWLRISGNYDVSRVDLTIPSRNGWHIDLKETWPGRPTALTAVEEVPIHWRQFGNTLRLTASTGAVNGAIYALSGECVTMFSLYPGQDYSISLPAPGCYVLIGCDISSGSRFSQKVFIPFCESF